MQNNIDVKSTCKSLFMTYYVILFNYSWGRLPPPSAKQAPFNSESLAILAKVEYRLESKFQEVSKFWFTLHDFGQKV